MFSICALAGGSVAHSRLNESKVCFRADYSRFGDDCGGGGMSSEFPPDAQIALHVEAILASWPREWEVLKSRVDLGRIYRVGAWGPTLAANMAKGWFWFPESGKSCRLGTAERERVLVQVAAIMVYGPMAKGSEAGLISFFNNLFAGPDKRLGFTTPGELMQAAVPYMGDLVDRDLVTVAYRATHAYQLAQVIPDQFEMEEIVFGALVALEVWPMFFQGLTLKKPLFS
jgi:hypothetical protein